MRGFDTWRNSGRLEIPLPRVEIEYLGDSSESPTRGSDLDRKSVLQNDRVIKSCNEFSSKMTAQLSLNGGMRMKRLSGSEDLLR